MKAVALYKKLENDFIKPGMTDDWAPHMETVVDYLSDNFKKRSMGLVCDFANEITKVYSAVFPSQEVMRKILDDNVSDALLFVHHPSIWDIRKAPEAFQQMDRDLLEKFKEKKIAIYNLHVPLDAFGEYSTSFTLAKTLEIEVESQFILYYGALCGLIGSTKIKTISELKKRFEEAIGHSVTLYKYGDEDIKDAKLAIVAGGGLTEGIEEAAEKGVKVFITGVTDHNKHSQKAHDTAKWHGISILGGTHYSTEKFACMAMVEYFEKLGLSAEFIEDRPVMEDM